MALVGTVLLAIVVFAFVLEPLLRARPDEIVVDAVALPDVNLAADDELGPDPSDPSGEPQLESEIPAPPSRVPERRLGGDLT